MGISYLRGLWKTFVWNIAGTRSHGFPHHPKTSCEASVKQQLWWFMFLSFLDYYVRSRETTTTDISLPASPPLCTLARSHRVLPFSFLQPWCHVTASSGFPPRWQIFISWLHSLARRNKPSALLCTVIKQMTRVWTSLLTINASNPLKNRRTKLAGHVALRGLSPVGKMQSTSFKSILHGRQRPLIQHARGRWTQNQH